MNHPKKKMPRRYRLNKKKFAATILILGCIAVLVAVAVESLANAVDTGVMVDAGVMVLESQISSQPLE